MVLQSVSSVHQESTRPCLQHQSVKPAKWANIHLLQEFQSVKTVVLVASCLPLVLRWHVGLVLWVPFLLVGRAPVVLALQVSLLWVR